MTKIDKSNYTKEQNKNLLEARRAQKSLQASIPTSSTTLKQISAHTNKEYGFVIGNGTSRQPINLTELKQFGKLYACNAVYREFDPDYLVAVDVKMILEINNKRYQYKNPNVWTNLNKAYKRFENLNFFNPSKGWSSGPTALWLAAQHGYKDIYILGFDYKGLPVGNKVNNIYAGTENYKKTTDSATYYGNWLKQTATVIKENTNIRFHRVIALDNFTPEELNKFSNLKTIYIEDFQKMFGI
jgi:hypothetical protein